MKDSNKEIAVGAVGVATGVSGLAATVYTAGVTGISAAGLTSGLAATGAAGMVGGLLTIAFVPVVAGGAAIGLYRWNKKRKEDNIDSEG